MDIVSYINKMNRLYGSEQQVASNELNIPAHMQHQLEGGQLTPNEFYEWQSIPQTERPLTGAEGGRVYDTRQYFKPGGLVEPGVTHYGTTKKVVGKTGTMSLTEFADISPFSKSTLGHALGPGTFFSREKTLLNDLKKAGIEFVREVGPRKTAKTSALNWRVKNFDIKKLEPKLMNIAVNRRKPPVKIFIPLKNKLTSIFAKVGKEGISAKDIRSTIRTDLKNDPYVKYILAQGDDIFRSNLGSMLRNNFKDDYANKVIIQKGTADQQSKLVKLLLKGPQNNEKALIKLLKSNPEQLIDITTSLATNIWRKNFKEGIAGKPLDLQKTAILHGLDLKDRQKLLDNIKKSKALSVGYQNGTYKTILALYGPGGELESPKKLERAKAKADRWFRLKHIIKDEFPKSLALDLELDHVIPNTVLDKATLANPDNLIRVKPLPKQINLLKGYIDRASGEVMESLKSAAKTGNKVPEHVLERKQALEKLGSTLFGSTYDLGKISETGKIISFGNTETFRKQYLTPEVKKIPKIYNRIIDLGRKIDKDQALIDLFKTAGVSSSYLKKLGELRKLNPKAFIDLFQKTLRKNPDLRVELENEYGFPLLASAEENEIYQMANATMTDAGVKWSIPPVKEPGVPSEAISATSLPFIKHAKKIASGAGKLLAGIDLPPIQAAFALADPTTLAYTLPFSNLAAEQTGMYKPAKTKLGKWAKAAARGMPQKFAKNVLPTVSRASIPFSAAYGVGQVMKHAKPDYYIDPKTGEPTFYKREKAADVMPTMLDIYEQASQIAKDQDISYEEALHKINPERFHRLSEKEGGRVAFGAGGIDKGRRAFMKWLAGLTGAGVVAGTGLLKWGKVAGKGKTVIRAGDHIIQGTPGMPDWYIPLVNRIVREGDDVTKKLGTIEREIVHTKKISKGDEVTVYQDMNTGNVRVVYESPHNMGEAPIQLEYKAGEVIDEGKYAGKKTKSEFEAAEIEPVGRQVGPDDSAIEWDGENLVGRVEDLTSDTSKLKQFATKKKPTMKEIVKSQKKKKEVEYYKTSEGEAEYVVNKQGEGPIDGDDMFDEFGNYIGDD